LTAARSFIDDLPGPLSWQRRWLTSSPREPEMLGHGAELSVLAIAFVAAAPSYRFTEE
jgi:hypothetical protein